MAGVAVLGEGERADAGDVVRVDDPQPPGVGGVEDAALVADRGSPPQRVRHQAIGTQVGDIKPGLAEHLVAGGDPGADHGQRLEHGAEG